MRIPTLNNFHDVTNSICAGIQKFMNLWNWSESRVSFIVYGASFAVAVSLSILIATVGVSFAKSIFFSKQYSI